MTHSTETTASIHHLSRLNTSPFVPVWGLIAVQETVQRVPYKIVAKWLLQGRVLARHTDQLVQTGRGSFGITLQSALFEIKDRNVLHPIDAIDALRIQDYLLRYRERHRENPLFQERADDAISFCKGVLRLIEHLAPESHAAAVGHLYPYRSVPCGHLIITKCRHIRLSLEQK